MVKVSTGVILGALACAGLAAPAAAKEKLSKAQKIVAEAKRETGGAAWDAPAGCTEDGTRANGAVSYKTRFSLREPGMRVDSNRAGKTASMGFNGKVRWQAGGAGKLETVSDPAALKEAITTHYLTANGFFFPDRFPATLTYLREVKEAGRKYDVVEATPAGGRPLELWFDTDKHRLSRVVDRRATPSVTVKTADFRAAGALTIPYKLEVVGADGPERGEIRSLTCGAIDRAAFDPPAR